MRILVISTPVFKLSAIGLTGYGGLEHIAWQCAAGLAAKGHTVSLVAPDDSQCPGVTVLPIGPEQQVNEAQAAHKYFGEVAKFDVVIDHSWEKWAYHIKRQNGLKTPVLGVMHAPVNFMYQSLPPVDKPSFVCISKDQAAHFQALFSTEARVCYNGVDLDYYRPLDIPRSSRFLFLARFSSVKGPDLAIQACRQAAVGLDLVGDTKLTGEAEYLESIRKLCDRDRRGWLRTGQYDPRTTIDLCGPANRAGCVWWFSQAHCLIHPNQRFREPFGLAPVEAMACGCPVIAWDFGAMRETIQDGTTGWLVKSMQDMDRAIRLSADWEIGDWQRKACRDWAAQFSLERMVNRYEELAIEAVDTGGW